MTAILSGFGGQIQLISTNTFPFGGITITEFSDDTDALDIPTLQIADKGMGVNGDLAVWSKANPLIVNFSLLGNPDPNSDNSKMQILLENNRVGKGKRSIQDIITMTISYPSGLVLQYQNGIITDGMPGNSISNEGKIKTFTYSFAFQNKITIN